MPDNGVPQGDLTLEDSKTVSQRCGSDVTTLVGLAVLAPSSHNTQPWLFRTSDTAIDVFADRTRALPVNDPEDRELTISCGCALFNLRAAAAARRVGLAVRVLPAADDADWLARVYSDPRATSAGIEAALSQHIERRRTYRRTFQARAVDPTTIDQLVAAATAEGAWLLPIEDHADRRALAQLVAEGDTVQWSNPSWRRELAAWMHPRRQGDGLTIPGLAAPLTHFVVRTFDMGGGIGAKDRELAEASPLMAVLGTERDDPIDWLTAGQALQRILLTACQHDLQASFLNQPVQVTALRPKLQDLVNRAVPQVVLRLGYPEGDMPATPRRSVHDVLEPRGRLLRCPSQTVTCAKPRSFAGEVTMGNRSRRSLRRAVAFSASALLAVLVGMKLLSRRTYDATDPRSRANGYLLSHTVSVARSPREVFDFITYRMKDHNLALAAAHEKFELLQGEGLTLGALFRTEEFTGEQGVRNEYVVREVIPNRRIQLASTPSRILRRTNDQVREIGTCNAYVYFDLDQVTEGTRLTQTIVIEMPNFLIKFISDLMGGRQADNPWQHHLVEELESLKAAIEHESRV